MKYFALAYPFPGSYTIFALLFFLLSLLWISKRVHRNTKKAPPEAAGAWPLLGHLPVLGSQKPAHMTLGNMADKYGPVFTIKLGVHRALIVSSWEIARECFTTNDKAFANRPKYLAAELMGYNLAMFGFSPYGPYWRQVRKIATLELLSNHRLEMLKNVRESEVRASIDEIYELWKKKKEESNSGKVLVEMRRWFGDTTLNVILRMVVGKRFAGATTQAEKEESERCSKAIREFFKLGGEFVISDALPFLRRWDLGGQQKAMKETAKELDGVLEIWLEQHKQKKISGEVAGENDFMDMMLSVLDDDNAEEQSPSSYGVDTINKATCLNFEFIPFGTGRRVCPGISFALQVMHLLLANLLHAFEITTPLDEPVDMGETSGITNMKATPLEVVLGPRIFAW
ncbi:hypothetical protein FEM48_Zijuj06G0074200 [Ziziphus jujuba var. spinosa]|uniref:Cytochrome P450 CYP82D47-like n=1 Tax=Ziziphus jujuba var. spinosa TaxID=714518 RepID=A0A978V7Y6_ZIZJJ|nr:hypothetical protein FEM48_Zijuj06G0074200 [Ziziphus jujuba var. spinosa]